MVVMGLWNLLIWKDRKKLKSHMTTRETYSMFCLKPWWIISGIGVCFIASKDMV